MIESGWYLVTAGTENIYQGIFPTEDAANRIKADIIQGAKDKKEPVPNLDVIHLPRAAAIPKVEDIETPQANSHGFNKPETK